MKAILEYTNEEYVKMHEKLDALHKATDGVAPRSLFDYKKRPGRGYYTFGGYYTETLVECLGRHPDEEEIIMLVDSGYSHFGASCTINRATRTFSGRVNTD